MNDWSLKKKDYSPRMNIVEDGNVIEIRDIYLH